MKNQRNTISLLSVNEDKRDAARSEPFVIIETLYTVDGPRSRITSRRFPTLGQAERWISDITSGKIEP